MSSPQMKNSFNGSPTFRTKSSETRNETKVSAPISSEAVRQMKRILRHAVRSEPLTDRLDIDAFAIQIENVAAKNSVLADNCRRSHQLRHSLWLRFAIIVHQPHMRAGKGKSGPHSLVKAAGAASVFFQANWVEISAATRSLAGEEFPGRLIGSVVDDHKLADRVSLRVNRLETSFKKRWTVPRYDDCHYSNHERKSLIYKGQ